MKEVASLRSRLVHPESLRAPLQEALSDLFISCWPDPDLSVEPFAQGLSRAVEGLLCGDNQVQLPLIPSGLVENLILHSARHCDRVVQGSRGRPAFGYSFRLVIEGLRVGAVLLVDVTGTRGSDQALVFLQIAALFQVDEFDRHRHAILRNEYEAEGLTDALVAELTPKLPASEQTLDYDLDFTSGPSMR
ncbi:hypothetical protein [Pseudomonas amygdali]|uniref:hypothetical protein n=1 Tax=Pseudomonas amygdali TaxID=47877 RepID=UPI0006B8C1B8|nr:hypothetical protein [Pseudomonas amygdali]